MPTRVTKNAGTHIVLMQKVSSRTIHQQRHLGWRSLCGIHTDMNWFEVEDSTYPTCRSCIGVLNEETRLTRHARSKDIA